MHVKFSGLSGGNPTCMWELQTAVSIPSTSIRHSMGEIGKIINQGNTRSDTGCYFLGYSVVEQSNLNLTYFAEVQGKIQDKSN